MGGLGQKIKNEGMLFICEKSQEVVTINLKSIKQFIIFFKLYYIVLELGDFNRKIRNILEKRLKFKKNLDYLGFKI